MIKGIIFWSLITINCIFTEWTYIFKASSLSEIISQTFVPQPQTTIERKFPPPFSQDDLCFPSFKTRDDDLRHMFSFIGSPLHVFFLDVDLNGRWNEHLKMETYFFHFISISKTLENHNRSINIFGSYLVLPWCRYFYVTLIGHHE